MPWSLRVLQQHLDILLPAQKITERGYLIPDEGKALLDAFGVQSCI